MITDIILKRSRKYLVVPFAMEMDSEELEKTRLMQSRNLFKDDNYVKVDCLTCNKQHIKIDDSMHYGHCVIISHPTSSAPDVVPFQCTFCKEPFLILREKKKHESSCPQRSQHD